VTPSVLLEVEIPTKLGAFLEGCTAFSRKTVRLSVAALFSYILAVSNWNVCGKTQCRYVSASNRSTVTAAAVTARP
jgi:hypothetical protein